MVNLVRGINPVWSFVDLVGQQLDDTYYFFTLQNTLPYLPSPVYHDQSGSVVWSNPIELLANGTLPVDIYFDPSLTYRLEWRAGPTQADALIYLVENYIPDGASSVNPGNTSTESDNQITNPQFSNVAFTGSLTITTPTETPIAPGWSVVTTGTGTLVVTQGSQAGNVYTTTNASNASTYISLNNNGFSTVTLRQRFNGNGALWTGKAVAMNFTASADNATTLTGRIVYSSGTPASVSPIIASITTTATDFSGASTIAASTNADLPASAWTDVDLSFAANTTVYITSVQVVAQDVAREITYIQTVPELPVFQNTQIPSQLVGWDFPLNPAQFATAANRAVAATAIGANKSKYVWDQTIIFQSADSGVGVTSGTSNELLLTAAATTKMAIIQYLGPTEARKILNAPICVNVSARASTPTIATVSLWYTTDVSLPAIGSNNSLVLTLDANGKPATFNGTWTEVPVVTGSKQFTIGTSANTSFNDYAFAGWNMAGIAACNTATFFAIVVGTASVTSTGTVGFNSVSLQPGYLPTRPAAQTKDEVLRECQYYYERSYAPGVVTGTVTLADAITATQGASVDTGGSSALPCLIYQRSFGFNFKQTKRAVPSTVLWSTKTLNTSASVTANLVYHDAGGGGSNQTDSGDVTWATYWGVSTAGTQAYNLAPLAAQIIATPFSSSLGTGPVTDSAGWLSFHYVSDSRLAIV